MDRFDAMRVFTRVVERRSFTLAAGDLGPPRWTVTDVVKHLEARLGVRLLERTTRHVGPTLDGEAYHRRCLSLIADLEDAEGAFGGARPKGLLRVEVQGTLARHFLYRATLPFPQVGVFLRCAGLAGEAFFTLANRARPEIEPLLRAELGPDLAMEWGTPTTLG